MNDKLKRTISLCFVVIALVSAGVYTRMVLGKIAVSVSSDR